MLIVPLSAVPAQTASVTLAGQSCTLAVYQKRTGLYFDIAVADVAVRNGILCLNGAVLVREPYLGFIGDLAFLDIAGTDDPDWTGLGGRFLLAYLETADLASYALT